MSGQVVARTSIEAAFERLKETVSYDDARTFNHTELKDVRQAALNIEKRQRERKLLRNLARIEPLLTGIQQYAGALETLCQGTPYLPWIWAPIKLMLQIASQHSSIIEKLLEAYAQIAEALPRFDRYQKIFQQPDFQNVVALVYADILEFHRRAYKLLTRRAWNLLFQSLWTSFEPRFQGILRNLERHKDLVDREAVSFDIAESSNARARAHEELDLRERERTSAHFQEVVAWLAIEDRLQDDDFDSICQQRVPGTCDWVFQNRKFNLWADDNTKSAVLWIWGIPGSGKTILCAHLVDTLRRDKNNTTLYYFCGSPSNVHSDCSRILRSLAVQLLRLEPALATYVYATYVRQGVSASIAQLRKVLPDLLGAVPPPRILIDGLDECDANSHLQILSALLSFSNSSRKLANVLISSREGGVISKKLRAKPTLSLRDESSSVENDIRTFVEVMISRTRSEWGFDVSEASLVKVQQELLRLSNGMFLWVQLVVITLQYQYTEDDLLSALNSLPRSLEETYDRIFEHIFHSVPDKSTIKKLHFVFRHLAYTERPLQDYEVLSAVGTYFSSVDSPQAKTVAGQILELCKPIVELSSSNVVDFVHFSAKEYLRDDATKYHVNSLCGHESILQSCLSYISTTRDFLDHNASPSLLNEIVKRRHGVHRYAWEYWLIHLNKYTKSIKEAGVLLNPSIIRQLRSLLWLHKNQPDATPVASDISRLSLSVFKDMPDIVALLSTIFIFQDSVPSMEQEIHDPNRLQIELASRDPTWLTDIDQRYGQLVGSLLTCLDPALVGDVDSQQLQAFRDAYGGRSFFCRYATCARTVASFETREMRDQHESTHVYKYKCRELNCFMEMHGFRKQSDLKLHYQKYHTPSGIPELVLPALPPDLDPILLPNNLEGLTINYAPNKKQSFKVELLRQFKLHAACLSTAISPDQLFFAIAINRFVHLRSLKTGKELWRFDRRVGDLPYSDENYARDVCFTPDGLSLIAAGVNNVIVMWDLATRELRATGMGHEGDVNVIAVSWDGMHVASASSDGTARVWDMSGLEIAKLRVGNQLRAITFCSDKEYLILGSFDCTVKIIHWRSGSLVTNLRGYTNECWGVDFLPRSGSIVSVGPDRKVIMWSTKPAYPAPLPLKGDKYSIARTFVGHQDFVLSVYEAEDEGWIVTGSRDGSIRIWDCETGKELCSIWKHQDSVLKVKKCLNNSLLFASSSGDKTVCIWSIRKIDEADQNSEPRGNSTDFIDLTQLHNGWFSRSQDANSFMRTKHQPFHR